MLAAAAIVSFVAAPHLSFAFTEGQAIGAPEAVETSESAGSQEPGEIGGEHSEPVGEGMPPVIPPPRFIRFKHPLPDLFLKNKKEHRYITPLPLIGVDPDTGFTIGAGINFFDDGSKESPFFRYAPYRQQIAVTALWTTKNLYQFSVYYDQPYLLDTPWRVRADATFFNNPVQRYFGIADDGLQLTSPWNGQVFGSFDAYQNNLDQVIGGQTYSSYDLFGLKRASLQMSAEYDLLGGVVRPLVGLQFAYNWVTDYTNDIINGAVELPTHLRQDCAAGRARGCGGGVDNFVKLGLTFDTRNFEPDPSIGVLAEVVAELSPKFLGSALNYGRLAASLHGFGQVLRYKMQRVVLAGRFFYQWQFGDVPVTTMNTLAFTERDRTGLGGLRTLRGYKADRFIGPVALLTNMEMRWSFYEFTLWKQNIKMMAVPFFDAGRPFENNSAISFNNWKLAGGAGLRLAWNLSTIVCFDYGFSPEGSAFYMDLSHQF